MSGIATNSPFKLADQFIRHGLELGLPMIVVLRLMAPEGSGRSDPIAASGLTIAAVSATAASGLTIAAVSATDEARYPRSEMHLQLGEWIMTTNNGSAHFVRVDDKPKAGCVWPGDGGRWRASAAGLAWGSYRTEHQAELAVERAITARRRRQREAAAPASLLFELPNQGPRRLTGDSDNHLVVAPSGRKDGAVIRTARGRRLAWDRSRKLGEYETADEAEAAIRRAAQQSSRKGE